MSLLPFLILLCLSSHWCFLLLSNSFSAHLQEVEKGKTKGGNQKGAEGEKGVEDHSDGSDDQSYEDNKGEASEDVPGEVGEEGAEGGEIPEEVQRSETVQQLLLNTTQSQPLEKTQEWISQSTPPANNNNNNNNNSHNNRPPELGIQATSQPSSALDHTQIWESQDSQNSSNKSPELGTQTSTLPSLGSSIGGGPAKFQGQILSPCGLCKYFFWKFKSVM